MCVGGVRVLQNTIVIMTIPVDSVTKTLNDAHLSTKAFG